MVCKIHTYIYITYIENHKDMWKWLLTQWHNPPNTPQAGCSASPKD